MSSSAIVGPGVKGAAGVGQKDSDQPGVRETANLRAVRDGYVGSYKQQEVPGSDGKLTLDKADIIAEATRSLDETLKLTDEALADRTVYPEGRMVKVGGLADTLDARAEKLEARLPVLEARAVPPQPAGVEVPPHVAAIFIQQWNALDPLVKGAAYMSAPAAFARTIEGLPPMLTVRKGAPVWEPAISTDLKHQRWASEASQQDRARYEGAKLILGAATGYLAAIRKAAKELRKVAGVVGRSAGIREV